MIKSARLIHPLIGALRASSAARQLQGIRLIALGGDCRPEAQRCHPDGQPVQDCTCHSPACQGACLAPLLCERSKPECDSIKAERIVKHTFNIPPNFLQGPSG